MSDGQLYIFARLEPKPGKRAQVLDELMLVLEPTRAEPGCLRIHLYQSTNDPFCYFVHSVWTDAAAFEAHVQLPHTQRFSTRVEELLAHPLHAVRTKQIA